jgi:hypothetical protein
MVSVVIRHDLSRYDQRSSTIENSPRLEDQSRCRQMRNTRASSRDAFKSAGDDL